MGLFRGLPARFPLKACHWQPFRALQAPIPYRGASCTPDPANGGYCITSQLRWRAVRKAHSENRHQAGENE